MSGKSSIPKETYEAIVVRSLLRCEDCKVNKAEHIHHLTYERKGHEIPEDLQYLCVVCHGKRHPHHNFKTKWEQQQLNLLKGKGKHKAIKNLLNRIEQLERRILALEAKK